MEHRRPGAVARVSATVPVTPSPGLAELAFHDDARPYSWLKVLLGQGSHAGWVLGVLSRHLRPGDNAPELLRRLASRRCRRCKAMRWPCSARTAPSLINAQPIVSPDAPATSPVLWIRRHGAAGPTATEGRLI